MEINLTKQPAFGPVRFGMPACGRTRSDLAVGATTPGTSAWRPPIR